MTRRDLIAYLLLTFGFVAAAELWMTLFAHVFFLHEEPPVGMTRSLAASAALLIVGVTQCVREGDTPDLIEGAVDLSYRWIVRVFVVLAVVSLGACPMRSDGEAQILIGGGSLLVTLCFVPALFALGVLQLRPLPARTRWIFFKRIIGTLVLAGSTAFGVEAMVDLLAGHMPIGGQPALLSGVVCAAALARNGFELPTRLAESLWWCGAPLLLGVVALFIRSRVTTLLPEEPLAFLWSSAITSFGGACGASLFSEAPRRRRRPTASP